MVGIKLRIGAESGQLDREAHDPAVGVGALHRYVEHLAG